MQVGVYRELNTITLKEYIMKAFFSNSIKTLIVAAMLAITGTLGLVAIAQGNQIAALEGQLLEVRVARDAAQLDLAAVRYSSARSIADLEQQQMLLKTAFVATTKKLGTTEQQLNIESAKGCIDKVRETVTFEKAKELGSEISKKASATTAKATAAVRSWF